MNRLAARSDENKTDEELVVLTLKNQDCFLYLVERYEKKLFNFIARISGLGKEETEDVLQEVFIKVYKNLNDFDPALKFSSWVYRIARNEAISHYRKKKSRVKIVADSDDSFLENLTSGLDLAKKAEAKDLKKTVYRVLARLDVKYREVLVLRFMEERDYREISDILRKPLGTVSTLIGRAKKQFAKESIRQKIKL